MNKNVFPLRSYISLKMSFVQVQVVVLFLWSSISLLYTSESVISLLDLDIKL